MKFSEKIRENIKNEVRKMAEDFLERFAIGNTSAFLRIKVDPVDGCWLHGYVEGEDEAFYSENFADNNIAKLVLESCFDILKDDGEVNVCGFIPEMIIIEIL